MKARAFAGTLLLISLALCATLTYSQAPQGFNYQAVIRNGSGNPIANQPIGLRITLENASHVAYYTETHTTTSNAQGVISVNIGGGTRVGSNLFSDITWEKGDVYIKLEIDPTGGTSYTAMGDPTKLQSVPYALYAENTKEILSLPDALDDDPIFEVKNKNGQVVFGVYQGGVRVYVEDSPFTKGAKGGFAVGGLTLQAKGEPAEYMRITSDSARIYINEMNAKGAKGGFAVGGLTLQAKTIQSRNLMYVAPDSTRIYVNENVTKGAKGGFAVGGLTNQGKGKSSQFLNLTPLNYFIGHNAGRNNTTGSYNSVLGYESAFSNTKGSDNVFIGYQSGYSNTLGLYNVFIGKSAGYNNIGAIQTEPYYLEYGSYNVFIGNSAGYNNISGWTNLFLGNSSGFGNTTGSDNTYIGNFSGQNSSSGMGNAFLGAFSGRSNISGTTNVYVGFYSGNKNIGNSNTFIGAYSGEKNENGQNNTFVGTSAGNNSTGSSNVFIGSYAGLNEAGSSILIIDNNNTGTPLLWGDFSSHKLVVAGAASNNPSNYNFYVNGTAGGNFAWNNLSDIRLKKNIFTIPNALDRVIKLRGVNFEWKDSNSAEKGIRMGFVAQEAETIIPEVVSNEGGTYSMQYAPITALLVEAIKDQQKQIEELKEKNKEIDMLKAELEAIKTLLKK